MENILLIFCRELRRLSPEKVAAHLGISVDEYMEIETGKALPNRKQDRQMAKLFGVKVKHLYSSSQQLDMLLARTELVNFLRNIINEQKKLSQELKSKIPSQKPTVNVKS